MENNVDADFLTKNVAARRSSEPVSMKVDETELKESKILSNSFGDEKQLREPKKSPTNLEFDKTKKPTSPELKVDHIGRLFDDKNPIKRIPTQVSI